MPFSSKKSLGQNFLNDQKIIDLIVETGNINSKDIVLEVGPGTGSLTEKILDKKPKDFILIEKDKRFADYLHQRYKNKIKVFNEEHPSNIISPPFPPAPPSGPPNSTYFSLRKLTHPFPPLPDCK